MGAWFLFLRTSQSLRGLQAGKHKQWVSSAFSGFFYALAVRRAGSALLGLGQGRRRREDSWAELWRKNRDSPGERPEDPPGHRLRGRRQHDWSGDWNSECQEPVMATEEQQQEYIRVLRVQPNRWWEAVRAPGRVPGTNSGGAKKGSVSIP